MKILIMLSFILLSACASVNDMAKLTSPLMVGQTPRLATQVKNVNNKSISLRSIIKKKPTVLVFYRGGVVSILQ